MRKAKFCAMFLISVILAGVFILSSSFSSVISGVTIEGTGQIETTSVTAESGSAKDIQAAVNLVASAGGGNVHIPSGTFNFVETGQPWKTVNIPVGVNLFGAPTERDANGQVIAWKTVLVMPYEVATSGDQPAWFLVSGNQDPNVSFRFSDIELVGWRYFNNTSTTQYDGIDINKVLNFRVDHCYFRDMCGSAIWIGTDMSYYNRNVASGVIDHCRLVNTYGNPGFADYNGRTLGYGIGARRWASDVWDPNTSDVWGQFTNYTLVIEDNYFSKWRHEVCMNDGFHAIVRFNVFYGCYGIGEVDGHGSYADDSAPYAVGTRCEEVYNNTFEYPDDRWNPGRTWALNIRGGSWIATNNTLIGYYGLLDFNNDWGNYLPYVPKCAVNQTYIWNNELGTGILIHYNADSVKDVNYFLRAPTLAQDRLKYEAYPYPAPLTQ